MALLQTVEHGFPISIGKTPTAPLLIAKSDRTCHTIMDSSLRGHGSSSRSPNAHTSWPDNTRPTRAPDGPYQWHPTLCIGQACQMTLPRPSSPMKPARYPPQAIPPNRWCSKIHPHTPSRTSPSTSLLTPATTTWYTLIASPAKCRTRCQVIIMDHA